MTGRRAAACEFRSGYSRAFKEVIIKDLYCHAELVEERIGLKDDKGMGTPGSSGADEDDNDDDVPLTGADITSYRGVIARRN